MEILEQTLGSGDDEWSRFECYVLLVIMVIFSYLQLTTMNKGLAMWKAVKNLPVYNVFYAIMSTTYGGIFFQEYKNLSTVGIIMFPIGVFFVITGITYLAVVAPDDSDPSDPGHLKHRTAKVAPEPPSSIETGDRPRCNDYACQTSPQYDSAGELTRGANSVGVRQGLQG